MAASGHDSSHGSARLALRLGLCAVVVGILTGALGAGFRWTLFMIDDARIALVNSLHVYGWPAFVAVVGAGAVMGALAGWLTFRFAPEASGSGIPYVESTLASGGAIRWARLLPVKFIGGLAALGAGMSLGREGPTVQMGAAIAEGISRAARIGDVWRESLIAAGAGAGLTAAFNAPIAGFLFIMEELRCPLTARTYGTGLIASVSADLVLQALLGSTPVLGVVDFAVPSISFLPWFAALGALMAIAGLVFNSGLLETLNVFARWNWGARWLHTAIAGALAAAVAWWLPSGTGGGEPVAQRILNGSLPVTDPLAALTALFVVKLTLTWVSYGSGAPGGLFAPLLVIGATLGGIFGVLVHSLMPGMPVPGLFALSGMVGIFAASVRVPVAGIILLMEMTDGGHQLLPFVVTATAAYCVAAWLGGRPIYEELAARDAARQARNVSGR